MANELKTIRITDDSDLAGLLEEANRSPVRLEKSGVGYRLSREDSTEMAQYDPAAVRDAVQVASGLLTLEEGEALKAYIYRAREEGSRPADRP